MKSPLPLDDARSPHFWRDEGRLEGPIMRYLGKETEQPGDTSLIRQYIRQWIDSPVWDMQPDSTDEHRRELAELRRQARDIRTREDIDHWMVAGLDLDIDPF